ncbi:hypothetical protein Moror_10585 [Moniliophthora roreri MCA 2997]|uniref:F-box domain-containing protein n=1 Tax=Moniliophthora roreri (strain MCA 2997) TaxID=1381753 RepID=V2XG11_MONRO|nr:hypothetical protein Moror_10585 [Moniliophthora roreri MCA 2997]
MSPDSTKREPPFKSLSASRSSTMQGLFRHTISPKERQMIIQWLLDAEEDLKAQHAEISRLKTVILTLENKRDGLKRWMEKYRTLLSPIHRLPPEILLKVFSSYCEDNVLEKAHPPRAVRLAMVCGRWRDLVLSTPELWASVTVRFCRWMKDQKLLAQMTKLFMERSKACALRLTLDFGGIPLDYDLSPIIPALDIFAQNSSRWREVTLAVVPPVFQVLEKPTITAIQGRLANLKQLSLVTRPYKEAAESVPLRGLDVFNICPSLHTLQFSPQIADSISLPWRQIKSLALDVAFSATAFQLVSYFPHVERLDLDRIGGGAEPATHILCDIKHLSIIAEEQHDVSSIFQYSTLRYLSSLDISGAFAATDDRWTEWDGTAIKDFFVRSSCIVTSLRLSWIPITGDQTISLLRFMPLLHDLHIEEYKTGNTGNKIVTPAFLGGLWIDHGSSSGSICPRLSELKLAVHGGDLDTDALLKAVTSRWLPDPPYAAEIGVDCLRSLSITLLAESDLTHTLASLLDFRGAGLRVNISHSKIS